MSQPSFFESFFATSPDMFCVGDLSGKVIEVNAAWEAALGYPRSALVGQALNQLVHDDDQAAFDAMHARICAGRAVRGMEVRVAAADGRHHWLRWSAQLDASKKRFHAVVQDVTEELDERYRRDARLKQLEARAEQLGMLSDMGELLQSSRGMDDAREVIDLFMKRIFPDHAGAVYVLDESRGMGEVLAAFGGKTLPAVIDPSDCWALRRGRAHWSTGEFLALDCGHARVRNLAHVCLPLMAQGMAKGLLHLELPHQEDVARESAEARFVNAVADHLGLAIANVTLRERLQTQSIRDPLTGCFNRRYLEETLVREMRRADREEKPLSVVMIDLDHFKSFNDTHGHVAADELLVELGQFFRDSFRTEDVVCRFGGEEFVILLPGATAEQAQARMERARQPVRELRAAVRVNQDVTFSAGVASAPFHTTEPSDIVRLADGAMYKAKTEGRDRVYIAERVTGAPSVVPMAEAS